MGAWPSFYLGLNELVYRHPDADAYLMVQDDVLFYDRQNLRAYLEDEVLWPTDPPGVISLFCGAICSRSGCRWFAWKEPWLSGALAVIFPNEIARAFVADRLVLNHRWSDPALGLAAIDTVIGAWCAMHGIPMHLPCPSLAQHIGDTSTLWVSLELEGRRLADRFLGDVEPD
jgi:hypothetical protein